MYMIEQVVSRWWGGTNLGYDRFRHILTVAREVIAAAPSQFKKEPPTTAVVPPGTYNHA